MKSKILSGISELKAKGYKIKYKKRSDGGYLVTEINGVKYKGASGNAVVRSITGKHLTAKETAQRTSALRQAHLGATEAGAKKGQTYKYRSGPRKGETAIKTPRITKEQRKLLRKLNKRLRQMGSKQKIGARQFRRRAKEEHWIDEKGNIQEKFFKDIASSAQRRAAGIAVPDRVEWFKEWGKNYLTKSASPEMASSFLAMVDGLESNPNFIWNEWAIQDAIDALYDMSSPSPMDLASVKRILEAGSKTSNEALQKIWKY